jgi:hypothetical protein
MSRMVRCYCLGDGDRTYLDAPGHVATEPRWVQVVP